MMILLSPAKTLDGNPPRRDLSLTQPAYCKEAQYLVNTLKSHKPASLAALFKVNSELALLNYHRFKMWEKRFEEWPYAPAILSFKGEVYRGARSWEWSDDDLMYAQEHLRILSGLFGLLKPLDNIQAYRLEMGTKLENRRGDDLYAFWKDKLTKALKKQLAIGQHRQLINLASKEYTKALDFKTLPVPVIEVSFKDYHNGSYKFLTVYGKHARGLMTRFIIQNQIEIPEHLKAFDLGGYVFNEPLSSENHYQFTKG